MCRLARVLTSHHQGRVKGSKLFSFRFAPVFVATLSPFVAACSSESSDTATASASSPIVKELQEALNDLGYDTGAADGIYGAHTTDAVKEFQTDAGITVDGKYGPETHKALEAAAEGSSFDWDEFAAMKELQTEMKDLGYYSGEIDGEYGPKTEAGIKAVQADCNITQDGIYGPDTHSCLLDLGGDA